MKVKKRIVLISPFAPPSVGGAETHLEDLYEYLRTHNYFAYVLTYQPITVDRKGQPLEKRKNLEIHRFRWIGHNLFHRFEKYHPIFNFLYLTPYLLLRSIIFMLSHRDKVDTINAHGLNAAFIAAALKLLFGKKAVMSTMALYCFQPSSPLARVSRVVLSYMDVILAETQESKDEIVAIGVPANKIVVFSHWVDQNKFKPENKPKLKKNLGWGSQFTALFVGRAIPIKGGDTLVKMMGKLNPKITVAVISDAGPLLPLFKRAAKKYPNLNFIGGVSYSDLHQYYKAADVFIIPSRYEEGAARVVMEAVSSGTPVIATNKGAIPSVLSPKVAIFIKPTEKNIKQTLEMLYKNKRKLASLTKNCYPFATKHFGFDNAKIVVNNF